MRLIDADELRKDVLDLPNCYNGFSDTYDKAMIVDLIDEQPTVEAEPNGKMRPKFQLCRAKWDSGLWIRYKVFEDTLILTPTVDAEPTRHGHWIFSPKDAIDMMFTLPKCSICGAESPNGGNYCSNCGAKMDANAEKRWQSVGALEATDETN